MSKKLQEALDRLNKEYGQGSVMILNKSSVKEYEVISTGSLGLDRATGIWGLPRGRIVEVFGPEMSGKTTLCLEVIAEAQRLGLKAAIVDMEHTLDLKYAVSIGVNLKELVFSQPDYGEQALNTVRSLAETGEIGVIVLDSIAACVPKAEIDGDIGDVKMALQARMFSQAFRILTPTLETNNTLFLMTNQLRMRPGVMYGSPEITAGGEAAKFYASLRIDMRKQVLREEEKAYANKTKIKVVKNKVAAPYETCEVNIVYGKGFDRVLELIEIASEIDVIKKAGSWYSYQSDKLGQGADAVKQLMEDNSDFYNTVRKEVIDHYKKIQ